MATKKTFKHVKGASGSGKNEYLRQTIQQMPPDSPMSIIAPQGELLNSAKSAKTTKHKKYTK